MSQFVIGYYAVLIGASCLAAYFERRSLFMLLFSFGLWFPPVGVRPGAAYDPKCPRRWLRAGAWF